MVDVDLVVALGHAHGREDAAGRVGPDDQVDLVDRDQLLVEASGEIGLGLIVEQHPLHRPPQQSVALVQLLDEDLARELVQERGRGQRAGERERPPDANGLT